MIIRRMTIEDIDEWVLMRSFLWPSHSKESHEKEARSLLAESNFFSLIVEQDNCRVGFLEASIRPFANGCESQPVPFLEGIWVQEKFRRQKIAQSLVQEFEKWAIENKFSEIGSDVDLENIESQKAHLGWGFQETERVVYYKKELNRSVS